MLKVVITIADPIVIRIAVGLTTHKLGRYVQDEQSHYRTPKIFTLGVCLVVSLFL